MGKKTGRIGSSERQKNLENQKAGILLAETRTDLSPLHADRNFELDTHDNDEHKDTALVVACRENNLEAIKLLLDNDANPELGCFRRRSCNPVVLEALMIAMNGSAGHSILPWFLGMIVAQIVVL